MYFQDLWWNISMSSLVIQAASHRFLRCRVKKTDRQTQLKTVPPATAVDVANYDIGI